ncbi:hypothetical protein [Haliangium ochraceum]|uniref:hypothetical protein n=1 Tax=Haliangium ochraceum TaxID=80816 RepID=UPI001E32367B|nr:hypothetical protein [Haliangium ochraceum]
MAGAQVRVWQLDLDGQRKGREPLREAVTDDRGRFRIEMGAAHGNLLVESAGGETRELWSEEPLGLDPDVPLEAIIPLYIPVQHREIVVSPFTSVAAALVERRPVEPGRFHEAMQGVHALLGGHLGGIDILDAPVTPIDEPATQLTPGVRHGLLLGALSMLAGRMAEETGASVRGLNTMMLTAALREDARDESGLLDGVGPEGAIALGFCVDPPSGADTPLCRLSAQTLRQDLAETLAFHLLGSAQDGTGLSFGDGVVLANEVAQGTETALFGNVQPGNVGDERAPVITPLASPYYEESEDAIAFEDDLTPVHVRSEAARIDLSEVFENDCDREIHKHVDVLGAGDANPLRWRFAVKDDLAGFDVEDLLVQLRVPGVLAARPLAVTSVELPEGETAPGRVFEVFARERDAEELARVEGRYNIEIAATDRLGNTSPVLRGCWRHVPRAAPLWAGSFNAASGPGSFDERRLESNNLAPVLRGDQAPVLARLEVQNNTDEDVFLTLRADDIVGRYSATWTRSRVLLSEEEGMSDCLETGECFSAPPPDVVDEIIGLQPIPDSLVTLRVFDLATGVTPKCPNCRPNEVQIAAGGHFEVQAVVSNLAFLVPPSVNRTQIQEIQVGPIGAQVQLTGVDRRGYVHCEDTVPGSSLCRVRLSYQLFHALARATLQVDSLTISAVSSPLSTLAPRSPQPPLEGDNFTFSLPVSTAVTWTTEDASIPVSQ